MRIVAIYLTQNRTQIEYILLFLLHVINSKGIPWWHNSRSNHKLSGTACAPNDAQQRNYHHNKHNIAAAANRCRSDKAVGK